MADLLKRASSLSALNLPNLGHRRVSSNSLYEDDAGDGTPHIEIARRTMGGRVLITLVRCLLVYTLFEDGVRILRRPAAQASVLDVGICGKLEKGHRGNERIVRWQERIRDQEIKHKRCVSRVQGLMAGMGLGQIVGSISVVLASDPRMAAGFMAAVVALNLVVYSWLVPPDAHVHGLATFVCRGCGALGGLVALVAHGHTAAVQRREPGFLDDANGTHAKAKAVTDKINLVARVLLAPYFPCSGVFHGAGRLSTVAGYLGGLALLLGAQFSVASGLLVVLLAAHGLGSYTQLLDHHAKHRDALIFAFGQDLAVLGALVLLGLVGPGGLSVDKKLAKRS